MLTLTPRTHIYSWARQRQMQTTSVCINTKHLIVRMAKSEWPRTSEHHAESDSFVCEWITSGMHTHAHAHTHTVVCILCIPCLAVTCFLCHLSKYYYPFALSPELRPSTSLNFARDVFHWRKTRFSDHILFMNSYNKMRIGKMIVCASCWFWSCFENSLLNSQSIHTSDR